MSETTDEDPKDQPRLMTSIDGESARLLVHIEPIKDAEDRPTDRDEPGQGPAPDSPGLAQ
ncbi:MAG TPA: hypothetical protein VFK43_11170 [Acidimicrobiales bacterium]|nr:hypothetical protein [Acidimicrobiales bacterium]